MIARCRSSLHVNARTRNHRELKMPKSILISEMLAALLLSSTAARSQCVTQFSDQLYMGCALPSHSASNTSS